MTDQSRVLTVTLTGDGGRCAKCKMQLRAGSKVTIRRDGQDFVEFKHFECPPLADNTGFKRVIQGAKK